MSLAKEIAGLADCETPGGKNEEEEVNIEEMIGMIDYMCSTKSFRVTQRKECNCLVRRIKLLVPFLDELKDIIKDDDMHIIKDLRGGGERGVIARSCLVDLKRALLIAKRLLKTCHEASKIYLALDYEAITGMFHSVNSKISQCLDRMPFEELGISDETREQVDLTKSQLKRAKKRTDTQDMELVMDMMVVFGDQESCSDRNADIAIIKRLAKNLDLHSIQDLSAEAISVRKFSKEKSSTNPEMVQKLNQMLEKFRQVVDGINVNSEEEEEDEEEEEEEQQQQYQQNHHHHHLNHNGSKERQLQLEDAQNQSSSSSSSSHFCAADIPQEFLCPISLEIMTDPVIVATGQSYERESIQKWLNSNHTTCPKTGQVLTHLSLAPNYALKNIITQWCEKNNVRLITPSSCYKNSVDTLLYQGGGGGNIRDDIMSLIKTLSSSDLNLQRDAVHRIRMLTKEKPENRKLIAECGGIPPLCSLLSYPDLKIQEHAVTSILNLSIDDANKRAITSSKHVISSIIDILQHGNVGARENSAAALFSLSMLDENKVTIGLSGGIPPLVDLLQNGTLRGKKDAATALFNLCLNYMNKERAVEAGIVKPLLKLLRQVEVDHRSPLVDEAMSILLLLVAHPVGRTEIVNLKFIETLVQFMRTGTTKNKEGATAILLELGINGSSYLLAALQYGVYDHLVDVSNTGTTRARRKAAAILQLMSKYEQIP